MSKNITWGDLGKWALVALISLLTWQFNQFNETLKENTKAITVVQYDVASIKEKLRITVTGAQAMNQIKGE